MMFNCDWLPDLLDYDSLYPNFDVYDEAVYRIFCIDFINNSILFLGKLVKIYSDPRVNGKEQTYFHITSKNYDKNEHKNRIIDVWRCQRIRWPKALIEHYNCKKSSCNECSGIKCWRKLDKKGRFERIKILFEEMQYVVILEDHSNTPSNCFFLVTAYYIENKHQIRKLVREYQNSQKVV